MPSVVFFQGPLGKSDKRQARWKDATLREERTEIKDTAGALQTFSGKRKLVRTLLRIRLTKNWIKVLNSSRFITKGVEKKTISGQLRETRALPQEEIPSIRDKLLYRAILQY